MILQTDSSRVMDDQVIFELLECCLRPWSQTAESDRGQPPTPKSRSEIEASLGIRVPELMIELAIRCPGYGAWFCGIGEDSTNSRHILVQNQYLHACGLSPIFVAFTQCFDETVLCWNKGGTATDQGYPVVEVVIKEDRVGGSRPIAFSFRELVENRLRSQAPRLADRRLRKRAIELLQA